MKKYFFLFTFSLILLFSFQNTFSQTVYVTKTGKKYHSSGCKYLKSSIPIDLQEALSRGYSACSRCNPTLEVTNNKNATKTEKETIRSKTSKSEITSIQCQATTKKGTQCKRKAKAGSNYCWQHGG